MQEKTTAKVFLVLYIFIGIACSSSRKGTISQSQSIEINLDSLTVYKQEEIDKEPQVIGGMFHLAQSMDYPERAKRSGIHGEVVVKFVVLKSGIDVNHSVVKSVHPVLDKAALQTIRDASFEPGIKDGKPVNSFYSLPLNYRMKRF